ncbi:DUF4129 domain-containing protein [Lysobacter sp. S4-A87]|uniref:DUF4129 domain-containing protein n=1 Tax=Lysobacter sp. S4-A87 TaxID=2925843 RepID=UPI001F53B7BC|nr:DUF4129 domain-containing protein [Lysobacter sp. S4-A87]UNK48428.1 DUF4129 domain-containing protein [Lysobacter sp. S4-A87]
MKIESLTVALRPRTAWEAIELGTALTRRHAAAIWKPWLALTIPILLAVNALAWVTESLWLAGLVMWWLKPVFDRIPLYVLSRAVFGDVPTTRQTLQAQRSWGLRWALPYLTWRRLGPVRSLYMPVDLLEGGRGSEAAERRRTLGAPAYGVGAALTIACVHFEIALLLGFYATTMLFVPDEYLSQFGSTVWKVVQNMPAWLQLASNLLAWVATSLIEPFFVGAGLGLYLNRRTEIEAWDIELALRRLGARLASASAPVLLLLAFAFAAMPAVSHAQDGPPQAQAQSDGGSQDESTDDSADDSTDDSTDDSEVEEAVQKARNRKITRVTPEQIFGRSLVDDASLRKAVTKAYADPTVSPKRTVATWKPRDPKKPDEKREPLQWQWLGSIVALISEFGLWVVVGVLVIILLLTAPRWLVWFRDGVAREEREVGGLRLADLAEPELPLPDDVPSVVRRLWREGREREALALLYRASVEAMVARTEAVLVPGATEAECLRASRKLAHAEDRDAFARAVRTWQFAAYAQRMPSIDDLDTLIDELSRRFAWTPVAATPGVAA